MTQPPKLRHWRITYAIEGAKDTVEVEATSKKEAAEKSGINPDHVLKISEMKG